MARLPGPDALGNPPQLRSGRGVHPIGRIDTGATEFAKGIQQLGASADAMFDDQRKQDEALGLARANEHYTSRMLELDRRFEADPDYETYEQRFVPEAERIRDESGQLIPNPRQRELFRARQGVDNARYLDRVLDRGRRRRTEYNVAELDNTLTQLGNNAVANDDAIDGTDPVLRDIIRRNMEEHLDLAQRSGLAPPAVIQRMRERHIYGAIENDAANYAAQNPLAALTEIQQGDPRANTPSSGQLSEMGLAMIRGQIPRTGSPQARAGAERRLTNEAGRLSTWITENVEAPLTQLQHDALVSYGVRAGRDGLHEILPMINTGEWGQVGRMGNLTVAEQPSPPPPGTEQPQAGRRPRTQSFSGATPSPDIPATANFANRRNFGQPGTDLDTVATENGTRVTVNARVAGNFLGFLNELEAAGYNISNIGGHNIRSVLGTSIMSQHAYGNAIDINPFDHGNTDSAGGRNNLPPNVQQMAARWGLSWGGGWRRQDTMHFEYHGAHNVPMLRADDPRVASGQGSGQPGQPGEPGRVRVAQNTPPGTQSDVSPPGAPNQLPNPRLFNDTEQDMLLNHAPSSRFAGLPPDRQRVLVQRIQQAVRGSVTTMLTADLHRLQGGEDEVRNERGQTALDMANGVMTDMQLAGWTRRMEAARARRAAMAPVFDMSLEEARAHQYGLPEPHRAAVGRVITKLEDLARRDPNRFAVGGTLDRIDRAPLTGVDANGMPVDTAGERDVNLTLPTSPEVLAARARRQGRNQSFVLSADPTTGAVVIQQQPGTPPDPAAIHAAYADEFAARLLAQNRRGIPLERQRLLLAAEAHALFTPPDRDDPNVTPASLRAALVAAGNRVEQRYGPALARRIMGDVIHFSGMNANQQDQAGADALLRRWGEYSPLSGLGGGYPPGPPRMRPMPFDDGWGMTQEDARAAGGRASELSRLANIGAAFGIDGAEDEVPALFNNMAVPTPRGGDPSINRGAIPGTTVDYGGGRPYTPPAPAAQPTPQQLLWLQQDIRNRAPVFDRLFGPGAAASALETLDRSPHSPTAR